MAQKTGVVVFIDAGVEAPSQLVAGVALPAEVRVLSPHKDGIEQMTAVLAARPCITDVYIVAHGLPGCLSLGSAQLGLHTLPHYQALLRQWFAPGKRATLHLYGCNVAAGDAGAEFLARLHQMTGASVAASSQLVGQAERGGTWSLDTALGDVQGRSLLTEAAIAAYPGVLAITPGQLFGVSEDANVGDAVGTVDVDDPVLAFAITGGNPNTDGDGTAAFAINNAGQITVQDADDLDFEALTSGSLFSLQLTTDAGTPTAETGFVFISVTDVPEDPVLVSLTPNQTLVTEGSAITLDGIFQDPDGSQTVTIEWGDGTSTVISDDDLTGPDASGNLSFTANHIYEDNGAFTVDVTVDDGGGNPATDSLGITVNNAAPTIVQGETLAITLNEDSPTIFLLSVTDPSTEDTFTASLVGAPGNGEVTFDPLPGGSQLVTFTPDENFSGTDSFLIQIADDDGGTDAIAIGATVQPQPDAPTDLVLDASATTLSEGDTLVLSGSFTDPDDGDSFTVTVDFGDGSAPEIIPNTDITANLDGTFTFSTSRVVADSTTGVTVTVEDSGGLTVAETLPLTVNNVAPVVTGPTDFTVNEDESGSITLVATDLDNSFTWSIATDAANGTAIVSANPNTATQEISYTPDADFNGTDTFEVQVDDGDGGVTTTTVTVEVTPVNDAPTNLSLMLSDPGPVAEGTAFTLSGLFTDVDNSADLLLDDTHTVTLDFGNGTVITLNDADLTDGTTPTPSFAETFTYADDGTFTITATVTDAANESVAFTQDITITNVDPVITDPDGADDGATILTSVQEDGSTTFTLSATDVGTGDALTFDILAPATNGTVALGTPVTTTGMQSFTYTPAPNFAGNDVFTIQVSDGDGGTDEIEVTIPVTGTNDLPEIIANQFTITEGEELLVSTSVLNALDLETTDPSQLQYTVTGLVTDDSFLVSGVAQDTFTQADINNGIVTFLGNGDEIPPSFTVTVEDADGGTVSAAANVTFTSQNDAPVFDPADIAFTVSEGNTVAISSLNISATDEESDDQSLTFTVSNLIGGEFLVNGVSSNTFTLQEINQNVVLFSHDGTETVPTYTVTVSDGELTAARSDTPTLTTINDLPSLVVNQFEVTEGGTVDVTIGVLDAIDIETTDDSQLTYTIDGLAAGDEFLVSGTAQTTFTRADVLGGLVTFQDNGDETPPSFTVQVTDGDGGTSLAEAANITFTSVNDAPTLNILLPFTVAEGGLVPINAQNISAVDEESTAADLTFTISNLVAGEFLVNGTASTTFTLLEINQNVVQFSHDGSETPPTFTVTASDGTLTTAPLDYVPGFTPVNDPPQLLTNTLTLQEEQTVILSTANLSASDLETLPADLEFTVSNIQNGAFSIDGTVQSDPTVTFTLQQVIEGQVSFQQDGSNTAPAYEVAVSDGTASTIPSPAAIAFTAINDSPEITIDPTVPPFSIAEGATLLLGVTNINAADELGETPAADLQYTASSVLGGFFAAATDTSTPITSFTQGEIAQGLVVFVHDGSSTPPGYTLTVEDGAGGSASASFTAALTETNDLPTVVVNEFAITEDSSVTLSGTNILATDEESTATELVYAVTAVTNGEFQLNGTAVPLNDTFTQEDINSGLVTFVHDGSSQAPTYTLALQDADVNGIVNTVSNLTGAVTFTAVNDAPTLTVSPFTIGEGSALPITTAQISATDEESSPTQLTFTVDAIANAAFQIGGAAVTTFTQQDIASGQVSFVHDGSELAPSFSLTVSDDGTPAGTATADSDITFTNANDDPILLTNTLTVDEDQTVTLNTSNLSASDLETLPADLMFTASNITNGDFLLDDVALTGPVTFTLQDVIEGRISFQHDGSNTAPSYDVVVSDGVASTLASPATITFTAVNDNPTIEIDPATPPFTIAEGDIVLLNANNIDAVDEAGETAAADLQYDVSSVLGGFFATATDTGMPITSFSQGDINQGQVVFVHDGSGTAPSYTLTVSDTDGGSASASFTAALTETNDLPTVVVNEFAVTEAGSVTLSGTNLLATDEESAPADLLYAVTAVTNGEFQLNGTEIPLNGTFTQEDINGGLVSFVQDGSSQAPTYTLQLQDADVGGVTNTVTGLNGTVTFTPVNDAPVLEINPFTIGEGSALPITTGQILATDEESSPTQLTFTVDEIANADFQIGGAAVTTFTQQDIASGQVSFVHDGSELAPSFTLTVSDDGTPAGTATATSDITFTNANDDPVLLTNALTVSEGQTVTLSTTNLSASDLETLPADLLFTVANIQNGTFLVSGVPSTDPALTFTLQDVIEGRIAFQHDGFNTAPAYTVAVSDGSATLPASPAEITFTAANDNPSIETDPTVPPFTIPEGATLLLNATNIDAMDEVGETPAAELQYTASTVQGGFFALATDTSTPLTTFTQGQVNQGQLVFVHDGSSTAPSYTLTVTDADGGSDSESFTATLTESNDVPTLVVNEFAVTEAGSVTLSGTNILATDEESAPADLLYTLTAVSGGDFQLNGTDIPLNGTFTQENINSGVVSFVQDGTSLAPTYTLQLQDGDVGGVTNTLTNLNGTVTFTAVNDAPELTINQFTIGEGSTLPISTAEISATDEESSPPQLSFTVDAIANAEFLIGGVAVSTFTQQDIANSLLTFAHDGSELPPSFTLTVSDDGTPQGTATAESDIIFTNANDDPVLLANALTLDEGQTITLNTSNLSASDLETLPAELQFTVSNITNGSFLLDGTPLPDPATFLLQAVIEGRVSFQHDGSNAAPTYDVAVSDGTTTIPSTPAAITFTAVNDNPTITIDPTTPPFTIDEGGILLLNTTNINAEDEAGETPAAALQYTVSGVQGGFFASITDTAAAITTFSQGDIAGGQVVFVHDGSNVAPTYTLTVADTDGGSDVETFTATLTETNDGPAIVTNALTVTEGDTVILTSNDILATDEESGPADLTFNVVSVTGGSFQLNGTPATAFTQANIDAGEVTFVQDGSNAAPTYTLTVTDAAVGVTPPITSSESIGTVTFTEVNDIPVVTLNFPTALVEEETVIIDTSVFTATDEESGAAELTYTFADLVNASFQVGGVAVESFTQADIEAGTVTFVQDGSELGPSFTLSVTDAGTPGGAAPAVFTSDLIQPGFTPNNSDPVFTLNQLSPVEGAATILTGADLAATDDEDFPSELEFSIVAVTGGTFLLNGAELGAGTFDQADLSFGLVAFVDDDDDATTPGYTVRVTDSDGGFAEAAATVTPVPVNDAPVITTNTFTIAEGEVFNLNEVNINLQGVDAETTDPALLTYTVSEVIAGSFFLSDGTPTATFTQQQVDSDGVVFVHDGSEVAPSFTLTLSDPDGGVSSPTPANVVFNEINDMPTALDDSGLGTFSGYDTDENTAFTFAAADLLANDIDLDGPLALSILSTDTTATQGLLTDNGDGTFTYDPSGAFDTLGQNETAIDTFTYTVSDGGAENNTATATVTINVLGLSSTPTVFFDLEQSTRLADPTAVAPTDAIGGLPLADLFDEAFYFEQNPDVLAAVNGGFFASGLEHFIIFGFLEGRDPSVLYNEEFYLAQNPDVANAVTAGAFASGLEHYFFFGDAEGRNPSALFDQADYLINNPDVAAAVTGGAFQSAFDHYIEFGVDEGRLPALSLYNEAFYLENNPDVAAAVASGAFADGFEHFIFFGQNEDRSPSVLFDQENFLAVNPAVGDAINSGQFANGFAQYQSDGRFDGLAVF